MTGWAGRVLAIRILAGIAAIGLVLGLVGGALLIFGGSDKTSDDRKQLVANTSDFAVTYNTYDVAKLANYQQRVKGLLTPSYDKQFVAVTDALFKALKDKKQKSGDAKVLSVAVESIDEDSAETIVAVDANVSNVDTEAAVQRHFRWKISFTKTKGKWLVSKFESVAAVTAQTVTPTPTATTEGSGSE